MIVLGECGTAEFLPIYIPQIRDKNQTTWVKMWALEGLVNIVDEGGRLRLKIRLTRPRPWLTISKPSPICPGRPSSAALEVLSAMRQGLSPTDPRSGHGQRGHGIALRSVGQAEVRSEAARGSGAHADRAAVSKY